MRVYGKLPVYLGLFNFTLPEVMYYLYLPIRMPTGHDIRIPPNLQCCRGLVDACLNYADGKALDYEYLYLSARKGWASPDNPLNRPGWHADGFGTTDLNFVWWEGPGTRFAIQSFEGILPDHNRSLTQFDEQVRDEAVVTYPQHGLYAIDPSVVHATPIIKPPGCMRQYVKVSMSNHRYNLENNSHNYLFVYQWPLHSRETLRNDPHKAQNDFVEDII